MFGEEISDAKITNVTKADPKPRPKRIRAMMWDMKELGRETRSAEPINIRRVWAT